MDRSLKPNCPDIFVHVPKTAGTSLQQAIIMHYGPRATYWYNEVTDSLFRTDKGTLSTGRSGGDRIKQALERMPGIVLSSVATASELVKKRTSTHPEAAFAKASAITGHLTVDRYADLQTFHSAPLYTVVREPLARMVSQYRHTQRSWRVSREHGNGWASRSDPRLSFRDLCFSETLQNFQTGYTGTDFGRYALVGTTENVGQFMLATGLVADEDEVPHVNRSFGSSGIDDSILRDNGFIKDFRAFHAADYAFYDLAVQSGVLTR